MFKTATEHANSKQWKFKNVYSKGKFIDASRKEREKLFNEFIDREVLNVKRF